MSSSARIEEQLTDTTGLLDIKIPQNEAAVPVLEVKNDSSLDGVLTEIATRTFREKSEKWTEMMVESFEEAASTENFLPLLRRLVSQFKDTVPNLFDVLLVKLKNSAFQKLLIENWKTIGFSEQRPTLYLQEVIDRAIKDNNNDLLIKLLDASIVRQIESDEDPISFMKTQYGKILKAEPKSDICFKKLMENRRLLIYPCTNQELESLLCLAAHNANHEVVRYLLGDLNVSANSICEPIEQASYDKEDQGRKFSAMMHAISNPLNYTNTYLSSHERRAHESQVEQTVEALLEYGGDLVSYKDEAGRSVIEYARRAAERTRNSNPPLVEFLKKKAGIQDAIPEDTTTCETIDLTKAIGWGIFGLVAGGLSAWMASLLLGYMIGEIVKISALTNGVLSAVVGGADKYDENDAIEWSTKNAVVNAAGGVISYGIFAATMPMIMAAEQVAWAIAVGTCINVVALPLLLLFLKNIVPAVAKATADIGSPLLLCLCL